MILLTFTLPVVLFGKFPPELSVPRCPCPGVEGTSNSDTHSKVLHENNMDIFWGEIRQQKKSVPFESRDYMEVNIHTKPQTRFVPEIVFP